MRHLFAVLLVATAACSPFGRATPAATTSPAPPPSDLRALLATTDSLVRRGEFAEADNLLVQFARRREGGPALEIPFWRALYKLDPRNTAARRGEAADILDAYARSPRTRWYKSEANVLRHLARHLDTLREAAAPITVVAGDSTPAGLAARDTEIRTLRAELARVNAELERIKRRLASPNP